MSVVRDKLPDGIRAKQHASADFDTGDFLALHPIPQCALGNSQDFRGLLNVQKGLEELKRWRLGWLGRSW